MRFLILSLLSMELLLPGVYSGDVLVEPRGNKPQCKNPKGKLGEASFYNCGQAVCKKSGKSAAWNICPQNAKETTVEEIQKSVKETEMIVKETEKTLNQIKKKVNTTEIKVKETDITVKETKQSVYEIEKTVKVTEMIVKETEMTLNKIEKKVNETEIKVKDTEMTVNRIEKKVNETKMTVKETENMVKETDMTVKETDITVKETEKTINKIENKVNETEMSVKETEKTVKETVNTVNEIEKKVKETEKTVNEIEKKISETEINTNEIKKMLNINLNLLRGLARTNGIQLPVVFYNPLEFVIENNNLVTELAFLGKEYILSFDLLLTSLDYRTYYTIIHLTIGGNAAVYGDRTPAVWVFNKGFQIASAINGAGWGTNTNIIVPLLQTGKWIHLEISQLLIDNKMIFEAKVDDVSYWVIENKAPAAFEKIKVFSSANFYNPAAGKIKNLKIQTKRE